MSRRILEVPNSFSESAREERLEVAELLADGAVTLAAARRKAEAGLGLFTGLEWIVLAYYVQLGSQEAILPFRGETMMCNSGSLSSGIQGPPGQENDPGMSITFQICRS